MSETSTRKKRDEVYKGLKISLEVLTVAVKISPIPGLEGVITTVKSIMDVVEVNLCLSLLRLPLIDKLGGKAQ